MHVDRAELDTRGLKNTDIKPYRARVGTPLERVRQFSCQHLDREFVILRELVNDLGHNGATTGRGRIPLQGFNIAACPASDLILRELYKRPSPLRL